MKFTLHIDKEREEEILIYAREDRPAFAEIKRLALGEESKLVGYEGTQIVVLNIQEVTCFVSQDDKVYALVGKHRYWVKKRLYRLQEQLGHDYVRINQSCIANLRQISRFSASIGGSLQVIFRDGSKDYVSRRELKNVKERIGMI